MRRLREQFPDELVIISIHSAKFPTEGQITNIKQAAMRHGIDHPVVNDAEFQVWNGYAVRAWPTVVLINPAGKIVYDKSGEILADDVAVGIQELIDEAEAEGHLDRTPLDLRADRTMEPMRPLSYPSKLLFSRESDNACLFIADTGHHRILQVRLDDDLRGGEVVQVFGTGQPGLIDGAADEAQFHDPHGLALWDKTLYVADTENHVVRAINLTDGAVRTVAGTGRKAHGGMMLSTPTATSLRSPWALSAIEKDVLFIAMAGSHQIWVLVQEGQIGPFFGNGREALVDGAPMESSFNQPSDLGFGMGHLFVADAEASAIRAIALSEPPSVVTLIGLGLFEWGDVDGVGGDVRLQHPKGLVFANNLVYIADSYNHKIKTLDPTTGTVTTVVGTGQPGHADGSFTEAQLFEPEGVLLDGQTMFIADTNNHLIRVADLNSEQVHTLTLRGLERLVSKTQTEELTERLEAISVEEGTVEITLDVALPDGYKRNDGAPHSVTIDGVTHTFGVGEPLTITASINEPRDLALDLTYYYCEADDQRLCMIHQASLVVPVEIGGDKTEAVAAYQINLLN